MLEKPFRGTAHAGSAAEYRTHESEPAENGESINGNRMRREETAGDRAGDAIDEGVARGDRDIGRFTGITGREHVMGSKRRLDKPLGEGSGKGSARAESAAIGEEAENVEELGQSLKRRDETIVEKTRNTVDEGMAKAQPATEVVDSSTPTSDQLKRSSQSSASPRVPSVASKKDVSWNLFIRYTISTVLEHIGYIPRDYRGGALYGPISTADGVYIAEHQSIRNQLNRNVPKIIEEVMKGGIVVTVALTLQPSGGIIDSWDLLACPNCEISMRYLERLLRSAKQKCPVKPDLKGCSVSIEFKSAPHSHEKSTGPHILRIAFTLFGVWYNCSLLQQTTDADPRTTPTSSEVYVDNLPDHPPEKHAIELLKFFEVENDSSRLRCLIPTCGVRYLVNDISSKYDRTLSAMGHFKARHKEVAVKTRNDTTGCTLFIEWEDWQVLKDQHIEPVDKWNKAFDAAEENRKALREAFDDLMNSCDRLYSRITTYPDQAYYILIHGANAAELKRGLDLHHDTVNQRDVEVLDVDCDEKPLHDEAPTTVHTVAMPAISQAGPNTASGSKELSCRTMKETMPDVGRKRSSFWSYFAKDFEVVHGQRTAVAYCKYCDARFLNSALQMAEHAQKCTKILEELGSARKAKSSLCRT